MCFEEQSIIEDLQIFLQPTPLVFKRRYSQYLLCNLKTCLRRRERVLGWGGLGAGVGESMPTQMTNH